MMRIPFTLVSLSLSTLALLCAGCGSVPGYPKPEAEVPRPGDVLEFRTLYKGNCSGCHGVDGRNGAALPLNNAAYLAIARADRLRSLTAKGLNGTLMPAFANSTGGMLTDRQIDVLVEGMLREWGRPQEFASIALPPYADGAMGDTANGEKVFVAACARCHGVEGTGVKTNRASALNGASADSIVDPAYLALVSDQSIRSLILGGRPDEGMPDWRGYLTGAGAHALTPQEVSDVVAWIAGHRAQGPLPMQLSISTQTRPATSTGKEGR